MRGSRSLKEFSIKSFIKAIPAAILIVLAATVYISLDDKLVGSFLFAFALYSICFLKLNLFTGKIGYINSENKWRILSILIANILFAFTFGQLVSITNIDLAEKAYNIYKLKLNQSILSIFLKSFFCGILMFLAVDSYKKGTEVLVFLCVMVFILSGFEHSIANIAYLGMASEYSNLNISHIYHISICILGNSLGSIFFKNLIQELKY